MATSRHTRAPVASTPATTFTYAVIDSPILLKDLLKYQVVRSVLEDLYPERIREQLKEPPPFKGPIPDPGPVPFPPMMIPMGAISADPSVRLEQITRGIGDKESSRRGQLRWRAARAQRQTIDLGASVVTRAADYARDIARVKDILQQKCEVNDAPGLLLRFQEYDRTTDELAGGPYSGDGDRQFLGHAVTDEQGNYIFRFTRTLEDIAEEFDDLVAGGGPTATQLLPDLIIQVVAGIGEAVLPLYETALYPDIPNLKRIDLCIPEPSINPGPTACQGGRVFQKIGNIWTILGVGNTLDSDGRITATNPTGPAITRGAWVNRLDVFGCFLDLPQVARYTIRYRRPSGPWSFVQQQYTHIKIADLGLPNYTGTKVGSFDTSLAVDGGPAQVVPAYLNIELDGGWTFAHRDRKIQLSSALYENALYAPAEGPRTVEFWIEGYDGSGNKVSGADDKIELLIDNRALQGDISEVAAGAVSPGECALFELTSADQELTVRFKAHHPGGFMQEYSLGVTRGSNTAVSVNETSSPQQPLSLSYALGTHGNFFFGTFDGESPDVDNYVLAELEPTGASWLPTGHNFCAFSFNLSATPRVTNGYSTGSSRSMDAELVGISFTPPSGP